MIAVLGRLGPLKCAKRIAMATSDNTLADTGEKISIGRGEAPAWLALGLANRHGLVTGATGTGKTVSLQVMAKGFARAGVPVFAADIKGDLAGISEVGEPKDFIVKRAGDMGLTFQPDQFSTVFWDVFGEQGHPMRATVSEARIGPITPEERKAIMDKRPVKGKYDTTIDSESAYEVLQRVAGTAAATDGAAGGGGILGQIGAIVGTIFGTNVSRGKMSTGQIIARSVTRAVTNQVVGGVVADLAKSVGGSMGGSVGRALVRGALGGLLRR
jgi:hypothetical protein